MNKHPFKIAAIFSLMVFCILTITMAIMGVITMLLFKLDAVDEKNPALILVIFAVVSILMGTVFSQIFGKRPLQIIVGISEATKEIAKGNFGVRLNENIPAAELQIMAHNFNVMAKELAGIEMLRSDFIENVSHEFKTPLAAIEGYATLLQNKTLKEEKREEYTGKILYNTKRLSSLTGNILLLSSLENQEMEIKKESYSLDEQLRQIILLFEEQWNKKNLIMDIEMDDVYYYGNKGLLAQVWQNILGNAVKFVPDNGTIRVLLHEEKDSVKVSIVDNGPGMNEKVMERVYEKFYQGDASRTGSGNGLGLTLAKRIVDLHNGAIEVTSKEKKGTAFTVTLPLDFTKSL